MGRRNLWYFALVGAVCTWGGFGVAKALRDPKGGVVGMLVSTGEDGRTWVVDDVGEGGSAAAAGLRKGDRIVGVDGTT